VERQRTKSVGPTEKSVVSKNVGSLSQKTMKFLSQRTESVGLTENL
jgi:hypothetical protein